MTLITVGGFDLTPYILVPTYTMNEKPVYSSWTDGNGVEHWEVIRKRASGSFNCKFYNPARFNEFVDALEFAKQPGEYYEAEVYINNTVNSRQMNVRLDFSITINRKRGEVKDIETFGVTVTER